MKKAKEQNGKAKSVTNGKNENGHLEACERFTPLLTAPVIAELTTALVKLLPASEHVYVEIVVGDREDEDGDNCEKLFVQYKPGTDIFVRSLRPHETEVDLRRF
jgi:hypothetical protein